MVWVNQVEDSNIYRLPATGLGTPTKFISSTLRDQGPSYAPDGRIAFVSDRSGSLEIWIAQADGSNQVRVTHFNGPATGAARWSPDGRHLAFDSRAHGRSDIFVLQCEPASPRCGEPKCLTPEVSSELLPSWSADGNFVYFASNRIGRWEVWKQPAAGGAPIQVTRNGGYSACESPDGRWLYFSSFESRGIWRMPVSKSDGPRVFAGEELLIGQGYKVEQESWTVTSEDIFFVDRAPNRRSGTIRAYHIATKQTRPILALADLPTDKSMGALSISPDLRWLLYSQLDRSGSNVMVAENILLLSKITGTCLKGLGAGFIP
jgi:dipeptidyl aminopeptidase/acylaminoacyl peptidase